MIQDFSRSHIRKHWKTIYLERVQKSKQDVNIESDNDSNYYEAINIFQRSRKLFANSRAKCRIHPTSSTFLRYSDSRDHSMCELCNKPIVFDVVSCSTCFSLCHYSCILETYKNITEIELGSLYNTPTSFTCANCLELESTEKNQAMKRELIVITKKREQSAQLLIGLWMLRCHNRLQHTKQSEAICVIIHHILGYVIRRRYLKLKKKFIRVGLIELFPVPHIDESSLITITVHDTIKQIQFYRIDKSYLAALSEQYLLPGITSDVTIAVTISMKYIENGLICYCPYYQAVLPLRDIQQITKPSTCSLQFTQKIALMPSNNIDEVVSYPVITRYTYDVNRKDCTMQRTNDILRNEINCKVGYRMYYNHQIFLGTIYGPVYEVFAKKHQSDHDHLGSRTCPWWMCLIGFKLLVYVSYGKSIPIFVKDMKDCTIIQSCKEASSMTIGIMLADQIKWSFTFQSHKEAMRFESVIIENSRKSRTMTTSHGTMNDIKYEFGFEKLTSIQVNV